MDTLKTEMDNSYQVLSNSNQLIVSIQQAQDILNRYISSPRQILQQQYDSISADISLQIHNIKKMKPEKGQDILLHDIDSLLLEKNKIVHRLTGLFRSQSPLKDLDKKINRYDEIIQDSVMVTTSTDTIRVKEKQKAGFWKRLRNVFDPEHTPDTTVNITIIEQEAKSTPRLDTVMYADLKNITEEASRSYYSRIQGIEREVRELLLAEQNISLHISQLTNEFYNETIQIAWNGAENSEELTQKIFRFAIVVGALSVFFIIIIILFITYDLNKGQKARTDLAKEKQLTDELMESRHKLLLSVSHDIKTPLTSMMGYIEMWDAKETNEDKKRQLQSVQNSGQHILNMLTNLLEFSRLQQNSARINHSEFNLIELMEDIIGMFLPLTEEKELYLKFENLAPSSLYVKTDRTLIKQILINVVSNAVKYTLQGGITIRLKNENQLIFSVIDSGVGMDPNELPELFKPFSRIQNPLKAEGSGFGMYVTKGLVDLLNGTIEVNSEKGKGTSVIISLPISQIIKKDFSDSDKSTQTKNSFQKILLFEDDLSLGKMVKEYLTGNGHKVKLCNNPKDVNGFLRVVSLFDIVITDMQMREITGKDILKEIRETGSQIPVWLMTAHDDYTDEKALSEGFSGLVKKPLQIGKLMEIVAEKQSNDKKSHKKKENPFKDMFPQLSALFGDDAETIKDILAGFVQTSQKDINHLQTLIDHGNFQETQQLCHKIHPFLNQLDAGHLCTSLRKMDMLRGEGENAYPNWKEELSEDIRGLRTFTEMIKREVL